MALDMQQYYNYRQQIRTLYNNDIANSGDLCSAVLQLRDKNKCIESVQANIQNYKIEVELADGTDEKKKQQIIDNVAKKVDMYIVNNMDKIGIDINTDDEFVDEILNSDNYLFTDINVVGNSIIFNL